MYQYKQIKLQLFYYMCVKFNFQFSLLRLNSSVGLILPIRTTTTKHYNPKFKKHRAGKFLKIELPEFNEDAMTPEKMRQKMKERGVLPPRPWMERPFCISATGITIYFHT